MATVAYPPDRPLTDRIVSFQRAEEYPKEVWYFIASLIFLVSVFNWGSVLLSKFTTPRTSSKTDTEGQDAGSKRGAFSLRRLPLALVNLYRVMAFRCTLHIGSSYSLCFADVFLTCTYALIIFVWALVNTTNLQGMKFDWEYYSNRAGAMAASQFPLIVALGTKNNVISLLTGVSYEKMNGLHRMCSRVLFVLLWLHAAPKFYTGTLASAEYEFLWLRCALLAITAFSVLCLVSLRPIRAAQFEFFFYTHFILALVILVGGYYHTKEFKAQSYIWPSFLIWGLDRLIRLLRVIAFKVSSYFGSRSKGLDAHVELLSPHMVRLRVPVPPLFRWSPGQSAYIILPSVSRLPIEAHPFSIASIDAPAFSPEGGNEKGETYWKELVFLINAREGFTKRLVALATKEEGAKVTVLVDGPYGESPDLRNSDTVVLIAGGTGISYTLPVLLSVIRQGTARKVVFLWAIRDISHLKWVSAALKKAIASAPSSLSLSIHIYVTSSPKEPLPSSPEAWDDDSIHGVTVESGERSNSSDSIEKEKQEFSSSSAAPALDPSAMHVQQGRPDFNVLMDAQLESASGPVTVCVCGSAGIAQAVRSSLKFNPLAGPNSVLRGGPSVTLHVESFGYA